MFLLPVTFIFNIVTAKPKVVLTSTQDAILTPFQMQWWDLGTHQLKRRVTNDVVLHTTFTLGTATAKFNMAAAKPEMVLTSAPDAILTQFQRDPQAQQKCY